MDDMRWQAAPRPWEVVRCDHAGRPAELRIGGRRVPLATVADWRIEHVVEPNVDGYLAAVAMFMVASAMFVVPVLMNLLEPRFLLGAALFAGIGMTALGDLGRGRLIDLMRLHLRLCDGASITFSTCDVTEVQRLEAVLAKATGLTRSG